MYLKEIKCVGFKSFAEKINIEFKSGITGVVGPNGSGKSNIVDAIRWVMGEQSVKSLRGATAMTDVIFSGSKSRGALNVASVTLIFDNSDKYLPLDFSEVSIKRRVYRDGTNEYFLNNEACRLKDITDLFVDTGSSKESFNIISQGKVQEILSSKPEERRVIFEEAAGVLKYKKRKEEAVRKIEKTHENLKRINDIVEELEERVEPLKEQSEKAKHYLDTKEKLQSIEIALIAHDIETINFEYQNAKKTIDELTEEIVKLDTYSVGEEAVHQKEKNKLDELDSSIYETQTKLVEISAKVEKLKGDKNLTLERSRYQAEDQKIHNNLLMLKEEKLKVSNEIKHLQDIIKENARETNDLNNEIKSLSDKFNDISNEKARIIDSLNSKLRSQTETNHRIDILTKSIESSGALPNSVKAVLNHPKLRGIHNVMGKVIEVAERDVTAIEIALGASSNFIITDDEISAKEAINYLKDNKLGRATFFPLSVITARNVDEQTLTIASEAQGYVGVAADLVMYDAKYRGIIMNQLGNILVVENIDDANNLSRKINNRYKIVTLDGEIIHVGGSMTGGKFKRDTGLIKEKYELENLLKEIKVIEADCKNYENKINEADHNLKEVENLLSDSKAKLASCNELLSSRNASLMETEERLNTITKEISDLEKVSCDGLSDVEEKIMNDYYEAEREKQRLTELMEDLTKQRKEQNSLLEELLASVKQNNATVTKKQNELKDLEIKVNRMDVKLDNLLNTLNEEYSLTFETAKEKYILELDSDEARIKVNTLKADLRSLGTVNLLAIEEYERVSKRYDFLSKQKQDLLDAEDTLLEIIREMDDIMKDKFSTTFESIKEEFRNVFKHLFGGGEARLELTDESNILETGIEMIVQPPGKKLQHLTLLSGGEKSLTAISLLFAILKVRPVPFCILDEVEAALDEANVQKFGEYLQEFRSTNQFIIITHKKKTMEYADVLYGVTMQESGVSKLVSVKLENIEEYAKV